MPTLIPQAEDQSYTLIACNILMVLSTQMMERIVVIFHNHPQFGLLYINPTTKKMEVASIGEAKNYIKCLDTFKKVNAMEDSLQNCVT